MKPHRCPPASCLTTQRLASAKAPTCTQARQAPGLKQQGAALLMAMLTVALVAVLASTAVWQQWRTLSVDTAERQAQQAHWLLAGAQDWARVVLREDGRSGNTDHLAEPWSMPLQEARLSSFLAADTSGVLNNSDGLADQVFLSGRIVDMQSRLNLRNLVVIANLAQAVPLAGFARSRVATMERTAQSRVANQCQYKCHHRTAAAATH